MAEKWLDPYQVCGDLLKQWFDFRKGHRKARWKRKWGRFIKRCWYK